MGLVMYTFFVNGKSSLISDGLPLPGLPLLPGVLWEVLAVTGWDVGAVNGRPFPLVIYQFAMEIARV